MKKFKKISIVEDGVLFSGTFDKEFQNNKYHLCFNTRTGVELLRGVNGHTDPFMTDLPTMIDIGIMGHCKNKCDFCYQGDNEQPHMTLENYKRIIDETKHHINQVALGGRGDPNLHPDFDKILLHTRLSGVVPNYTTSGNGLTDDQVTISKLCGAVAVSDYRSKFSYDAMEKFTKAKIKTNVHFVLTQANFTDALKILYGHNPWKTRQWGKNSIMFKINKLNGVVFLLFKPQGRGTNKTGLIPTNYQMKIFSELVLEPKCKIKIGMDSCLVNHVTQHVKLPTIQRISVDTCEASRMSTYITPDMRMVPCSFADHDKVGVSLKGKTIEEVWKKGRSFKTFRKSLTKDKSCCPAGF